MEMNKTPVIRAIKKRAKAIKSSILMSIHPFFIHPFVSSFYKLSLT
jgi:hypothetical protein